MADMVADGRSFLGLALLLVAAVFGCGTEPDAARADDVVAGRDPRAPDAASDPALSPEALAERPWEVVSRKGETLLSNVFYAEPSENEQIMPWSVDGRAVIDRLVYPTLGNPNLYVKDDADDELVIVLRVEDDAIAHLAPRAESGPDDAPRALTLTDTAADGLAFFLVDRSQRAASESSSALAERPGVVRIRPSRILLGAEPADMPAALKKRHTLRAVFDQAALTQVRAGLYDARFEVRKAGKVYANVFETQFNAVRVFDTAPDEYAALNVSDTQVSVATVYRTLTAEKIDDFVDAVNGSMDPNVREAAFITFNGDLHNGGSPETIRQRAVATTYATEAKRVLDALKRLTLPIFLTPGNHDGYAATGHVPDLVASADRLFGVDLQAVVAEQNNLAWPDYSWPTYAAFLDRTKSQLGGLPLDLYTGGFTRGVGRTFAEAFREVPRPDRNMVLYDGFHQWQKTYGPLYASWTFAKNRYVSVNSYELRQHRRTGWGMFTVNYGGGIGRVQMDWIDRELARAKLASEDVVMLMHHDPRGGHKGKDLGYYFPQLRYEGVAQSTLNYLLSEVFTPMICKQPDFSLSVDERESCLHDGLQEWMAPDELDREGGRYFMSGVEVLRRIAASPNVRTLLVGHAHFNTMEVLQPGDTLVPNRLTLDDPAAQQRIATLEAANPFRRFSWEKELGEPVAVGSFDPWRTRLDGMLRDAPSVLQTRESATAGAPHELAILRLTSAADLSSQKYNDRRVYGWSILHVTKQTAAPRINRVTYFVRGSGAAGAFEEITTVDVDRTKRMPARDRENPVDALFDW